MNTERETFKMDKKKVLALVILILTLSTIVVYVQSKEDRRTIAQTGAHFVLSSWSDVDEYGQGLHQFELFENSTASWVQVGPPYGGIYGDYDPIVFNWTPGVAIKLRVYTWFNSTLTGAADLAEGQNLQRHNVSVIDNNDVLVFSKQNFTYFDSTDAIDPPMWFYVYDVVLNFLPDFGQYYTVTIIYEVYW